MGKFMEKAGNMMGNKGLAEKGAEKRGDFSDNSGSNY